MNTDEYFHQFLLRKTYRYIETKKYGASFMKFEKYFQQKERKLQRKKTEKTDMHYTLKFQWLSNQYNMNVRVLYNLRIININYQLIL
jgi:hypothetical protein